MDLFAGRVPSRRFWANHIWRPPFGLAYIRLGGLHRPALANTALAATGPDCIRLILLRISAVVLRNMRRIRLMLSGACPHQDRFRVVAARLDTSRRPPRATLAR